MTTFVAFLALIIAIGSCFMKVEIEEKYDKVYARSLYNEMRAGTITFELYEKMLREFFVEKYRIDTDHGVYEDIEEYR